MEQDSYEELVEEIRGIKEEMQRQTELITEVAESIVEELKGIKNEVSR